MEPRHVWAIIPARGGSKGIPRKNVRLLAGHPLIAYTIFVAKQSGVFEHIIVSTEDAEVEAMARVYGAEVPFRRPRELAGDESPINQVISYTMERAIAYYGQAPDAYVALYPTSPFRTPDMIRRTVALLNTHYWACTAVRMRCCPSRWYLLENRHARRISNYEGEIMVSRRTGHVTATRDVPGGRWRGASGNPEHPMARYHTWLAQNKGKKLQPNGYYFIEDTIALLDLDSEEDWDTAEWILKHGWFRFSGLLATSCRRI